MLIATGTLKRQSLSGEVVIVTGGGRGIGYEAVRALAWLGAEVVIAEIDKQAGRDATAAIKQELQIDTVHFVHTDISDERSVGRLARTVLKDYGKVDIVLNNATIAPLGAVQELSIAEWDASYRVNLRGPVMMARVFLPGMVERKHGTFVCVSSSGVSYMGAYEILKSAQVELANTLQEELEGTGVIIFTIGPGVAPTATATAAIERLASLYGQSTAEFYRTVAGQYISVEGAGAGFAAAIALANQFEGQETASIVALNAARINISEGQNGQMPGGFSTTELNHIKELSHQVYLTLARESESWQDRSVFERQWLSRNFRKHTGITTQQCLEKLQKLEEAAQAEVNLVEVSRSLPLKGLGDYYANLFHAAEGFVKDPVEREAQLGIVRRWQNEVECLADLLVGTRSSGKVSNPGLED